MRHIPLFILPILFVSGCFGPYIGSVGSTHQHATFKVYLDGNEMNLLSPKYMVKSQHVHIEGGDTDTIHKHATGVTLGYFFNTLNMKFDKDCFVSDDKISYCNNGDKKLKFYVNSVQNEEFGDHEIKEGEKYLISYGDNSEEEIQKQLNSIKNLDGK